MIIQMNITMSQSEDGNIPYSESYEAIRKSMKATPENYLSELASISQCMKRLEDFVNTLEI